MRILILSDRRAGHLNQSVAFARHMGAQYDIVDVIPKFRWSKAASILLENAGIRTERLFQPLSLVHETYDCVVGTGSLTYYMTKVVAKRLGAYAVAMMLPKGYRYDFDTIFAQSHDSPPKKQNIIEVPVNFAYVEPVGIYKARKKSVGIIIGGDNSIFRLSSPMLKMQFKKISDLYTGYEIAVTTSPRTSPEIEALIHSYGFDYEVLYSRNPLNPIPDFLDQCETVFITEDSTSMISEAVSYGKSNVAVLSQDGKRENKFSRLVDALAEEGYLSRFDGTFVQANRKVDFQKYLAEVKC